MPQPETLTRRALCEACYESFPEERLLRVGDRPLCAACAAREERTSTGRTGVEPTVEESTTKERPAPGPTAGLGEWVVAHCAGRWWLPRLLLLLLLGYVFARHLGDPAYQSIFKPLNLGIHELGHVVFSPFGKLLEIAGGSILQCLVPIAAVGMFLRQGDPFAIAVSFGWLGTNLYDVATYAGDARAMALPLVSPGGGHVIHDWNYLLGRLSMLRWDETIASALRVAGGLSMALSIVAGAAILVVMARHGRGPHLHGAPRAERS